MAAREGSFVGSGEESVAGSVSVRWRVGRRGLAVDRVAAGMGKCACRRPRHSNQHEAGCGEET